MTSNYAAISAIALITISLSMHKSAAQALTGNTLNVTGPAAAMGGTNAILGITGPTAATGSAAPHALLSETSVSGTDNTNAIVGINTLDINNDTLAKPSGIMFGTSINYNLGGNSSFSGSRGGLLINMQQVGSVTQNGTLEGIQSSVGMSASWGGTGTTPSTAKGSATTLNPVLHFQHGYVNGLGGSGEEVDIITDAGSTFVNRGGISVVEESPIVVQGAYGDAGFRLNMQMAPGPGSGWATGFGFGDYESYFPIATDGNIMGVPTNALQPAATVANAFYFPQIAVTGYILDFPNFKVSGGGGITVAGSTGVSCSGPPSSGFQVVNGIVTHC
ncbi:MAG TPA: hypothetical protein VN715_13225 [Roseiarcus sp.]|nr:hypothetical protein [Roseiarcus sp.]